MFLKVGPGHGPFLASAPLHAFERVVFSDLARHFADIGASVLHAFERVVSSDLARLNEILGQRAGANSFPVGESGRRRTRRMRKGDSLLDGY